MAGAMSLSMIGSKDFPGILVMAQAHDGGNVFCIVEGQLYSAAVNKDGTFETLGDVEPPEIDWYEVVRLDLDPEENAQMDRIIRALGGNPILVRHNMPGR